jgi:hypothetical protein
MARGIGLESGGEKRAPEDIATAVGLTAADVAGEDVELRG